MYPNNSIIKGHYRGHNTGKGIVKKILKFSAALVATIDHKFSDSCVQNSFKLFHRRNYSHF